MVLEILSLSMFDINFKASPGSFYKTGHEQFVGFGLVGDKQIILHRSDCKTDCFKLGMKNIC